LNEFKKIKAENEKAQEIMRELESQNEQEMD
jgi:hypothetical protein